MVPSRDASKMKYWNNFERLKWKNNGNTKKISSFARLKDHPVIWTDYKEYLELGKWVMDLSVTNDAAERGVKNPQKVALSSNQKAKESAIYLL